DDSDSVSTSDLSPQFRAILFSFTGPAAPSIYTLSLHDALPISVKLWDVATGKEVRSLLGHSDAVNAVAFSPDGITLATASSDNTDRKSTRLNSSHRTISYAVFCLKKKINNLNDIRARFTFAPSH